MEILIVVDMQNDFIDGSLGSPQAQAIVPHVVEKLENWQGEILFTRDTHSEEYLGTQEGKNLPVEHCVKGTSGWEIAQPLQKYIKGHILDKPTFGSVHLPEHISALIQNTPQQEVTITLVGLCTDICVISNALLLKPAFPEAIIQVDSLCCAGVTETSHKSALEVMKSCHIQII